ncbi:hypothetical protein [Baaleninema sp.]|uniref:hypothetical protein n=1 Tax=Baaleninema sp. TaxID=3101197 RepID=UPI003D08F8A4
MQNQSHRRSVWKSLLAFQLSILLALGLASCGEPELVVETGTRPRATSEAVERTPQVAEVSPPKSIQRLRPLLDRYRPQVSIESPRADSIVDDDTVTVRLNVQDLPVFKNETFGLGPYVQLFLDDKPERAVYDLDTPITLEGLSPGTHTLRAFAVRPWHESFKNEGAYAQTTFHIYTKTGTRAPEPDAPLLTYNRPRGTYGAEPILLDFYLTNAPLHIVAQESEEDDIADWRVKATVNGYSFVTDRWQPFYLTGFKRGKNWVKLEFIDEKGDPVQKTFNTTAELIIYDPDRIDTLSKLVTGELSAEDALAIVDPNVVVEPEKPEIEEPEPLRPPTEPLPEIIEPSPEEQEKLELPPSAEDLEPEAENVTPTEEPNLPEPASEAESEAEPEVEEVPTEAVPEVPEEQAETESETIETPEPSEAVEVPSEPSEAVEVPSEPSESTASENDAEVQETPEPQAEPETSEEVEASEELEPPTAEESPV